MRSFGLTTGRTIEIISAYAAGAQSIPSVPSAPGWFILGAFHLPVSTAARLEAIALVSFDVVLHVRLFDLTGTAPVSGATLTMNATPYDTRAESGIVQLVGNRVYQIQAQAIGSPGFAMIKSAQLI
jgi:hypothetical protein